MISRIALRWRWLRRMLSRTQWAAHMLGVRAPAGEADEPGLILIQIDGLSRTQFEKALHNGRFPFLNRLIRKQHFTTETFYSGLPSSTPAVQAELFFGVKTAVPSFQFFRRSSGRDLRMYEASAAAEIEDELREKCPHPLLEDAHSYSNIYRAGSAHSRYCSEDMAAAELYRRLHLFKSLVLCVVYAPKMLRILILCVIEFGIAILDAIKGLFEREEFFNEIAFVPARVAVCVLLREAIRFRVLLDIERGVQVIHANFLGYDEQAHRRGPDSAFAHWTLKGIDDAVRDIYRSAVRSGYRDYELMVYSDHGQERVVPYVRKSGREIDVVLQEVFSHGSLAGYPVWIRKMPDIVGSSLDRIRSLFGLKSKGSVETLPDPDNQIVVTAMGPVGHLYFPIQPDAGEMDYYALAMVKEMGIPLVVFRGRQGRFWACNSRGKWLLPDDRAEVFGVNHPFLNEVSEDFVRLCEHRDAGDMVISGWDPDGALVTFPLENGAHAGPGSEETRGFLLIPDRIRRWHLAHLAATRTRVRPDDLRQIVRHYLGRDGEREEFSAEWQGKEEMCLGVMTYNIHSCVGMDGKLRPERVARVINHCDPDIVAVQEVDCHRFRSKGHDQAQLIADHLRMHHVFQAMFEEERERYGIAIFSKFPLQVIKTGHLTVAAGLREARGAIWVKVLTGDGRVVHFINTHFGLGREERRLQAEELFSSNWLGGIPADEPVILCGDFNSGPASKVFKFMRSRMRDAQEALGGGKPIPTFSSIRPLLRIDHVFLSHHFVVRSVDVPRTSTSAVASDHLPICVELALPPKS
ncbi:MAG: endonuclease/exonuclease/phosphatase family protein [Luteolibacter sp.]